MDNTKVKNSLDFISKALSYYKNPIIMTSFGKDSMVMLYLIREVNKRVPCLLHRQPYFPKKYSFANSVIENWELNVYDFLPFDSYLQSKVNEFGKVEVGLVEKYDYSKGNWYGVELGLIEPTNGKFLCGYVDILNRPKGRFDYKWDCCFIGHKSSDTDLFYDSMELHTDTVKSERIPDRLFPIKDWTDEDIWEYSEENNIPQNYERYVHGNKGKLVDIKQGEFRGQYRDTTFNSDYFECCCNCICKENPELVYCPIQKKEIKNISSLVPYVDKPITVSYFGKQE